MVDERLYKIFYREWFLSFIILNMSAGVLYTHYDAILNFCNYVLQLIFINTSNYISHPPSKVLLNKQQSLLVPIKRNLITSPPFRWGLEYADCISLKRGNPPLKKRFPKHDTKLYLMIRVQFWMVGWLFGFYGISTFVGYLTPNLFFANSSISNYSV